MKSNNRSAPVDTIYTRRAPKVLKFLIYSHSHDFNEDDEMQFEAIFGASRICRTLDGGGFDSPDQMIQLAFFS